MAGGEAIGEVNLHTRKIGIQAAIFTVAQFYWHQATPLPM